MSVAINQTGQQGLVGEIEDFCAGRDFHVAADGFDFAATHQNNLLVEYAAVFDVDRVTGLNGGDGIRRGRLLLCASVCCKKTEGQNKKRSAEGPGGPPCL